MLLPHPIQVSRLTGSEQCRRAVTSLLRDQEEGGGQG